MSLAKEQLTVSIAMSVNRIERLHRASAPVVILRDEAKLLQRRCDQLLALLRAEKGAPDGTA